MLGFAAGKTARALEALVERVGMLRAATRGVIGQAIDRWRIDARAALFHLGVRGEGPRVVVLLGGTGTGKSTVINRLLEREVSTSSFHRTYTEGLIAAAADASRVPGGWGDLEVRAAGDRLPVRGEAGVLLMAEAAHRVTERAVLVDTPDVDGDRTDHHAAADRAFRWAEAAVFLVTPEKYQMNELLPYERLARRYGVAALFVMNKCEDAEVADDYREQLAARGVSDARVFEIPRDDAGYEPGPGCGLAALREAVASLADERATGREEGLAHRCRDVAARLRDKVVEPLRRERRTADTLMAALNAMRRGTVGVDVSPVAAQLERRLREQSVLYLMGPQRVLERARQVPELIVRLPRAAWRMMTGGEETRAGAGDGAVARSVPDFGRLLMDELIVVQSRVDDLVRSKRCAEGWIAADGEAYAETRMDPGEARRIAEEELAALNAWMEARRDGKPRDTRAIERLLRVVPGGERISTWSESAPYLLAVIVATHGVLFGPLDLAILGGYGLATWVGERLSNEVKGRVGETNRRIQARFERLIDELIDRTRAWLDGRVPAARELAALEDRVDGLEELLGGVP